MSWCNIDNLASQAVARRLGAMFERLDTTASGHQGQIWRHTR
jgi:RimJ/RimL family protein N-acetyltransferase